MPALYVYLLFRFIQEKDVKNLHCKGKINVVCLSSFFSVGPNICFILYIYMYLCNIFIEIYIIINSIFDTDNTLSSR